MPASEPHVSGIRDATFDPVALPGSNNPDMADHVSGIAMRSQGVRLVADRDRPARR